MANTHIRGLFGSLNSNDIQGIVTVDTNGTTPVNVFINKAPGEFVIKSVFVISLDTTAGNIIVKNNSNAVVTIAKGTTAGALVGGVTLAAATVAEGSLVTVESSTAGNARVHIVYAAV